MFEWYAGYEISHRASTVRWDENLEVELSAKIGRRSNLVWQEHCSECAMPACYATCDYYRPRPDFKCQRFDGGVKLLEGNRWTAAPMRLRFGKWARLLAHGPSPLMDVDDVVAQEGKTLRRARFMNGIPMARGLAAPLRRRLTNAMSETEDWGSVDLERLFLVVETYAEQPVALILSAKILAGPGLPSGEAYRSRLEIQAGHQATKIPVTAFLSGTLGDRRFALEIFPAEDGSHPELSFGLLDIVELAPSAVRMNGTTNKPEPGPLKCVVWDLDNTLWTGILIEDGLEKLRLRNGIREIVETLDARGVLQSVASKNNPSDTLDALAHFGLRDYFLHPQISWGPKSEAIHKISKRLNIGIDSLAFIDDQAFERAEVASVHPSVIGLDIDELDHLLDHPRLQYPITEESRQRRLSYQAEMQREVALSETGGDYDGFLRSCEMRVSVRRLEAADLERVYELAQRTNQLNLSTTRYSRDQLAEFMAADSNREVYTVRAEDRFGAYGLIGACVFDPSEALIMDMMFSCRVQSKLVDDTFVEWLTAERAVAAGKPLRANFRPSKKNAPARDLLERTGFEPASEAADGQVWEKVSSPRTLGELTGIVILDAPAVAAGHSRGT